MSDKESLTKILKELSSISKDVKSIKTDVSSMKKDIEVMKKDIERIKDFTQIELEKDPFKKKASARATASA